MIYLKSISETAAGKRQRHHPALALTVRLGPYTNVYPLQDPIIARRDMCSRHSARSSCSSTRAPTPQSVVHNARSTIPAWPDDVLQVSSLRIYYIFSTRPNISEFLESERCSFELTSGGRTLAAGNCTPFEGLQPSTSDVQVRPRDVFLFHGEETAFGLKASMVPFTPNVDRRRNLARKVREEHGAGKDRRGLFPRGHVPFSLILHP